MLKMAAGVGATASALAATETIPLEQWIGWIAKAGVQAILGIALVAETCALIWMTKKAMARSERIEQIAEKSAVAHQANADSQQRLSEEITKFATVIEKCSK